MAEGFSSSLEHLFAELKRIELKLQLLLKRSCQTNPRQGEDNFRGLYISDKEIDVIIGPSVSPDSLPTDPTITELEGNLMRNKEISQRNGLELRLCQLEHLFKLSPFEIDVLLVCLLPELNLKYQKLYAYLQDDVTRKNPTVNLVLGLLCDSFDRQLEARQVFYPEAPLFRNHIIYLYEDNFSKATPLLARKDLISLIV